MPLGLTRHDVFRTKPLNSHAAFILPFVILLLLNPSMSLPFHASVRSQKCPVMLPDPPAQTDITPPQPAPALSDEPITRDIARPRIINGDFVSEALRPYAVLFINIKSIPPTVCTGTLLSSRWALTAAHCEISTASAAWTGVEGYQNLGAVNSLSIEKVFNHPMYTHAVGDSHDIALVRLAENVNDGKFIRVNADSAFPMDGEFVRAIGYGSSRPILVAGEPPNEQRHEAGWLRQVDMPTSNAYNCRRYTHVDLKFHTCAGYERGGCSPCIGDSGGPLIRYDGTEPILVGVTSFGALCAAQDFPTVFIRTSAYVSWFDEVGVDFTRTSAGGLGAVTIAGIVIAVLAVVGFAVALIIIYMRRKSSSGTDIKSVDPSNHNTVNPSSDITTGPSFTPHHTAMDGTGVTYSSQSVMSAGTSQGIVQSSSPTNIQVPAREPHVPMPTYHSTGVPQASPQKPQGPIDMAKVGGSDQGKAHSASSEPGQQVLSNTASVEHQKNI